MTSLIARLVDVASTYFAFGASGLTRYGFLPASMSIAMPNEWRLSPTFLSECAEVNQPPSGGVSPLSSASALASRSPSSRCAEIVAPRNGYSLTSANHAACPVVMPFALRVSSSSPFARIFSLRFI